MTLKLLDPELPKGAVISVDEETGVATCNDGRMLQPAAKNPWYVLMTIAGEPENRDDPVVAQNRRYWNGWACSRMSEEDRADLAEKVGLEPEALRPLAAEERAAIAAVFRDKFDAPEEGDALARSRVIAGFLAADVEGAEMPDPSQGIDLGKIHFSNTVVLEKWIFGGDVLFDSATFSGHAQFGSATFSGYAYFGSATFNWHALFDSATFSGPASFGSATFNWHALFGSAMFSGHALFGSATFSADALFGSATFSGFALFDSATFSGRASFDTATFSGRASFDTATFSGRASFDSATFSWGASFGSATFSVAARFSDGAFGAQTVFTGARFGGEVPKFFQRGFHQDTDFTTEPEYWPEITEENAAKSKRAYTRLRQVMNELHKPDDEHFFGRQEMRCKALLEGRFQRVVSGLFELVSDYGYSMTRPLVGLALVVAVPWPFFASFLLHGRGVEGGLAIWRGLGLSFANVFSFLGFHRRFFEGGVMTDLPGWLKAMAGGQTLAGIVLLFFLGLGLRNRFRLK